MGITLKCVLLSLAIFSIPHLSAASRCKRCREGSFLFEGKCIKKSVECGKLHRDDGDACYKREGEAGKLPTVQCHAGDERFWDKCYTPCKAGFFADFEACFNANTPEMVYKRKEVAPLTKMCGTDYWLEDGFCRTTCPHGFAWDGVVCRVSSCPPGTTEDGDRCAKPTTPCL